MPPELQTGPPPTDGATVTDHSSAKDRFSARGRRDRLGTLGLPVTILLLVFLGSVLSPDFLQITNLRNVLTALSLVGIVAIGMAFVMISGGLADLSVPATIATGAIVLLSVQDAIGTPLAIVVALIATGFAGSINGFLVGYAGANPIIVTLGLNAIILGLTQAIVGGVIVYNDDKAATELVNGRIAGVPFVVIAFLAVALVGHFCLSRTSWGRRVTATGASPAAAKAAGVPTRLTEASTFVISGVLAGLTGVLLALSLGTARPIIGTGYEFDAATAAVVGGVSLFGGSGSVPKVLGGLLIIQLLTNILVLEGVPTAAQGLAKGIIIAVAVALDVHFRRRGGLEP